MIQKRIQTQLNHPTIAQHKDKNTYRHPHIRKVTMWLLLVQALGAEQEVEKVAKAARRTSEQEEKL